MTRSQLTVNGTWSLEELEVQVLSRTETLDTSSFDAAYLESELNCSLAASLRNFGRHLFALAVTFCFFVATTPSLAVEDARPENWMLDVDVHFWVPKHEVRTTTGADVEIGIDDVVREFDMTLQAGFKEYSDQ